MQMLFSQYRPKKQKKAAALLAIGTAQGHVLVWDTVRGEVSDDIRFFHTAHDISCLMHAFKTMCACVCVCMHACVEIIFLYIISMLMT
jgi:hypothetical protein